MKAVRVLPAAILLMIPGCYQSTSGHGDAGDDRHESVIDPVMDDSFHDPVPDPPVDHGEPRPDTPPDRPPFCGNGLVEGLEECDDGANGNDEDGCTDTCLFTCLDDRDCDDYESCNGRETCDLASYTCVRGNSQPDGTVCLEDPRSICIAEECRMSFCGDGFTDMGEECDDGNDIDDDACTNTCLWNTCGNGLCDGHDGCSTCPQDCGDCPSVCGGGIMWRGAMYWFCTAAAAWNAAEESCVECCGANLVVVNDSSEQDYVFEMVQAIEPSRVWWIGLTDFEDEGEWVTVAGHAIPYENWCGGEPNNSHGGDCIPGVTEEDCADLETNGCWNDYPCACSYRWFICERGP